MVTRSTLRCWRCWQRPYGRGIVRGEVNMIEQTRRYSIRLTDLESDRDVVFTVLELTDDEKRVVVNQIVQLTGVPEDAGGDFVDLIAPPRPRKPDAPVMFMACRWLPWPLPGSKVRLS